jgi:hypothetical protein
MLYLQVNTEIQDKKCSYMGKKGSCMSIDKVHPKCYCEASGREIRKEISPLSSMAKGCDQNGKIQEIEYLLKSQRSSTIE